MKNGNKTEELEMKLPIGLGFKLSFLSIFHFTVARACSSHPVPRTPPVPRFSNICFRHRQRLLLSEIYMNSKRECKPNYNRNVECCFRVRVWVDTLALTLT